jgi:hypothetical protein
VGNESIATRAMTPEQHGQWKHGQWRGLNHNNKEYVILSAKMPLSVKTPHHPGANNREVQRGR